MTIPTDIHTHRQPHVAGEAIVNCFPETFDPQAEGWYSVGIHPWHAAVFSSSLSPLPSALPFSEFEQMLHHPRVLAVGEAGLDKLAAAPLSLQVTILSLRHSWQKSRANHSSSTW